MTVSVKDPITAAGYNARVASINKWFGDIYSSNTVSDPKSENSYGWGNSHASTVSVGEDITAEHDNELIHRINLGVTNTGYGSSISSVSVGDIAYASTVNSIESNSTTIDTNRTTCVWKDLIHPATIKTWNANFSNSISITATITFASYAKARYFFNSGSTLEFQFSNSGGTPADQWKDLFNYYMGTIIFSYNDITETGVRPGTGTTNTGFYELTTTPTEIYSNYPNDVPSGYNREFTVTGSRNATGNEITLTFVVDNDGAPAIDGFTSLNSWVRKAITGSYSSPFVLFSIDAPTSSVLSSWTGS